MAAEDKMNTTPTLVIGLGGAGGNVIARVKAMINEAYGQQPQIRNLVSFLAIDADKFDRLNEITKTTLDPRDEFVFISGFNPHQAYNEFLDNPETRKDLERWFPEADIDLLRDVVVEDGASRCRPVGRFYLFKHRQKVRAAITKAIERAQRGGDGAQVDMGKIRVVIVCSCCGGTGSSTFLDVVYSLQREMRKVLGKSDVRLEAVVLLPEPFIRRAGDGLAPYLRANGSAFFRELDWLLKKPDHFNDFAMDSVSEGRAIPGPNNNGLPEKMGPAVDLTYVIDEGVADGGLGAFRTIEDLFDFTSRAVFYRYFEPSISSKVASSESNHAADLAKPDAKERPRRYAAFGYSEIRYPSEFIKNMAGLLARRDGLKLGLIGEDYSKISEAVDGIVEEEHKRARGLLRELSESLDSVVMNQLSKLPGIEVFHNAKGKVDAASIDAASLKQVWNDVKRILEDSPPDIDETFHRQVGALRETFATNIDTLIENLANGHGLNLLQQALRRLDRHLEEEVSKLDAEAAEQQERANTKEQQGLGGTATSPPQIAVIAAAGRQRAVMTEAFISDLSGYLEAKLKGHVLALKAEFFRSLAGDKGDKDPTLKVFGERTRRMTSGQSARPSILDERESRVQRLISALTAKASAESPETSMVLRHKLLGNSPTVQYLPPVFQTPAWVESEEARQPYIEEFPGMQPGNDAERQESRQAFVREFLEFTRRKRSRSVAELLDNDLAIDDLADDLQAFAEERVGLRLKGSLAGRLAALSRTERDQTFERLSAYGRHACRLDEESYNDTEDQGAIWDHAYLGAPSPDLAQSAQRSGNERLEVFTTPADRIVRLNIKAIFPYRIVKAIKALEPEYNRRGESNRPHLDHRHNRGGMEAVDPGSQLLGESPQRVFLKLYALSQQLEKDPQCLQKLTTALRFDDESLRINRIPRAFIWAQPDKLSDLHGMNAMLWNITVADDQGHYLLEPILRRPERFGDLFVASKARRTTVTEYVRRGDVVGNHQDVLAKIETMDPVRKVIAEGCEVLRDTYIRSLENLRSRPDYKESLVPQRIQPLTPAQRVVRDNEDWFLGTLDTLKGIIQELRGTNQEVPEV